MSQYLIKSVPFPNAVLSLDISQDELEDEMFSITCADRSIRVFTVDGREIMSKTAHDHPMTCICMSNEAPGRTPVMATCSRDNKIVIWNPYKGKVIRGLKLEIPEVRCMALHLGSSSEFNPVGSTYLILGSVNGLISIWDLNSSKCHSVHRDHTGPILCIKVALVTSEEADGTESESVIVVTGSSDCSARTFNLYTKKPKMVFQTRQIVGAVAIAGRGFRSLVASAGADGNIRVWDETSGILLHIMQGHLDAIYSLDFWFGHEILLISSSADRSIRVWDLLTAEMVVTLLGHNDVVTGCTVATNPRPAIISSSLDCTVKVWDLDYIIAIFYRTYFLCIPFNRGKRNEIDSDNPNFEYNSDNHTERVPLYMSEAQRQLQNPAPTSVSQTENNQQLEGQPQTQTQTRPAENTNFEDMFENSAPAAQTAGPVEVMNPGRRRSSLIGVMFGGNKNKARTVNPEGGHPKGGTNRQDSHSRIMRGFSKANAIKSAELEGDRAAHQASLQRRLEQRKAGQPTPPEVLDRSDSAIAATSTKKKNYARETVKRSYSMNLKRNKAAEMLRQRLAEKEKNSDKNKSSNDSYSNERGASASNVSESDNSHVEKDYDALISQYKDQFA